MAFLSIACMERKKIIHSISVDTYGEIFTYTLVILKLMGKIDISWGKVFLPMVIAYVLVVLSGIAKEANK